MHLWNTNTLIKELREETLTEREKMKYLLVVSILLTLAIYIVVFAPPPVGILILLEAVAALGITVWGTLWCYQANAKGDGKAFVERFIVLLLPVTVRLFVLGFIVYMLYIVVGEVVMGDAFDGLIDQYTLFDLAFVIGFEALFYVWLRSAIVKVSKK